MKVTRRRFAVTAAVAIGILLATSASGYRYLTTPRMPITPLQIETARGTIDFTVEVATTLQQQQRGLMYRRSLAPSHGMLFDLKEPKQISFWMENTYIPLDIIFIDNTGTIVRIAANARPLSEKLIRSVFPVRAVLEINGGVAAQFQIKPRDIVLHAIFNNAKTHDGAAMGTPH